MFLRSWERGEAIQFLSKETFRNMLFAENSETVILGFEIKTVEMFLSSGEVVAVKSSKYSLRTKIIRTLNTNVVAVLLYGTEMLRATAARRQEENGCFPQKVHEKDNKGFLAKPNLKRGKMRRWDG